jgi:hypothetical protein
VLEIRSRRRWVALIALAVPASGALTVLGTTDTLAKDATPVEPGTIPTVARISTSLGLQIACPAKRC